MGVTNVCVSAWLAGAFPYCYWVYHVFKFGLLLMLRCYKSLAVDHKLNIIEYCYLVNYLFFLYYILSLSIQDSWDLWYYDISYYLFRILFTACVGPLALSVLAFRNSVVFHNIDHLTSTVLHWTPQVSIWGMRWWVRTSGMRASRQARKQPSRPDDSNRRRWAWQRAWWQRA